MAESLAMMPWFPRDFLAATRGWSITATGVYRALLDAQWELGVLPERPDELRELIHATPKEWSAGWTKCESKFPLGEGGRRNPRLEEHRAKALRLSEKRRAIGQRGGQASAEARGQPIATPIGQAKVNHPSPSPSKEDLRIGQTPSSFDQFWSVYPKKVKRKTSAQIWKRMRLDSKSGELIADVQRRMESDRRWREGFIPDPTTYLNQERWGDALDIVKRPRVEGL